MAAWPDVFRLNASARPSGLFATSPASTQCRLLLLPALPRSVTLIPQHVCPQPPPRPLCVLCHLPGCLVLLAQGLVLVPKADSGAPSCRALWSFTARPPGLSLLGAHTHTHRSELPQKLGSSWRAGWAGAQRGHRLGSVKPSSSLQPDLGAQRGKGQVLAVLHYRHGRRHEHLGREGEACPPHTASLPPRPPNSPWQPPGCPSPSSSYLQKGPSVG